MAQHREIRFNMLLSRDEADMLQVLADAKGVTNSDLFRALLRADFARMAKESGKPVADFLEDVRHRLPLAAEHVHLRDAVIARKPTTKRKR